MTARVTASEARRNLRTLIEQVNNDGDVIEITSPSGDAVLLSKDEFDAVEATAHLLRSPANARRLLESVDQTEREQRVQHDNER